MLGRSIAEQWRASRPDDELVVVTRAEADLRDPEATRAVFAEARPDVVIHAAAKVGGIVAKLEHPTTYLLDNLLLDASVLSTARELGIRDVLYVASAAVYPEHYRQPFVEQDVLAAPLEPANEGYALAKIAGLKLCEYISREYGYNYRVAVPSNLYGPNDDYSLSHGHLIAAALAKVHTAQQSGADSVNIWGDGTARREFTYVVDLAEWIVAQAGNLAEWPALLNLGQGRDHSITEYYEAAAATVGFTGTFDYDTSKPAGMHERILDSSAARALGWNPQTSILDGMAEAYRQFDDTAVSRKASQS
jgi:GDP-L-fucose synthase